MIIGLHYKQWKSFRGAIWGWGE